LLGNGVREGRTRLIEPVAANVWLEIGSEGGLLSLGAVLWGLGWSLWRGQALAPHNRAIALALCAYFAVAWQFLQTFPRLDQWMSFWFALAMAAHAAAEPPQRLQNISSKSTSPSNTAPRSMPVTPMKRMLSAYLFALISGTQGISRASVRRSSWATFVVVSMS
jgi:hypothetical protein